MLSPVHSPVCGTCRLMLNSELNCAWDPLCLPLSPFRLGCLGCLRPLGGGDEPFPLLRVAVPACSPPFTRFPEHLFWDRDFWVLSTQQETGQCPWSGGAQSSGEKIIRQICYSKLGVLPGEMRGLGQRVAWEGKLSCWREGEREEGFAR